MAQCNIVQSPADEACSHLTNNTSNNQSLVGLFIGFINNLLVLLISENDRNEKQRRMRVNEIALKYTLLNESRLYPGVMCVLTYNYKMLNSL